MTTNASKMTASYTHEFSDVKVGDVFYREGIHYRKLDEKRARFTNTNTLGSGVVTFKPWMKVYVPTSTKNI